MGRYYGAAPGTKALGGKCLVVKGEGCFGRGDEYGEGMRKSVQRGKNQLR